jgi:outer membrane protein assembly factor BamA
LIAPEAPFVFGSDSITYSQYSLVELDFRYFKTYNRDITFGFRVNPGIGYPYANSQNTGLPYVKQFFAGGNNSIRAWRVRQLGPGGAPNDFLNDTIAPYQTGDFKFVMNFEGRFNLDVIFAGLEGAIFTDMGNVWSLTDDSDNRIKMLSVNSPFDNFFKRWTIGAGLGIRYDFSFFILRVDYAWRIRRAYSADGDDDNLSQYWEYRHEPIRWNNGRINLAIGYPF